MGRCSFANVTGLSSRKSRAVQLVCHWGCRRYSDVMVHRLLAASLGLKPLPESAKDRAGVRGVADNLNVRHRNAQLAGRASVELHTLIFFKDRTLVADARITRVRCLCNSCCKPIRMALAQSKPLPAAAPNSCSSLMGWCRGPAKLPADAAAGPAFHIMDKLGPH